MNGSYCRLIAIMLFLGCSIGAAQESPSVKDSKGIVGVEIDTNHGKIVLELNAAKAPRSVANFLEYANNGHYNNTVFHRVIEGFMIQGGGLDIHLKEKPTRPPVRNEADNGLTNDKYTVAMARTSDPHSANSQFFINIADNGFLNRDQAQDGYGYTVFGRVSEGKEVVDQIGKLPTQARPNPSFPAMLMRDVPATPIVIKSVKVLSDQL